MNLIFSTDWQLHDAPPHDQVGANQRSIRFTETVETIASILDAGMAKGADGLFFMGDLTEHKTTTRLENLAAAQLFTRVMDKGGYVWALAGNHDGAIFEQSSSSIEPLARMRPDQFKVFHNIEVDLELGCLAIPYIHKATPQQIKAMIRKAWIDALMDASPKPGQKFFAAMHYGPQGATMGVKKQQQTALDYLDADTLLLKTNPLDLLAFGHIHQGQEFELEGVRCFGPGSPTQQNRGEKNDRKTWGIFNTATRELEVFEIPQPRKFIDVPYSLIGPGAGAVAPFWTDKDIVTVTGEYEKPDYPKDTIETMITDRAWPRPFSLAFDTKPKRAARVERSTEISTEGGLRQALQQFLGERYPNTTGNQNIVAPAAELAMSMLEEQGMKVYHPQIDPIFMTIKDFLAFRFYSAEFLHGRPTLIQGKNGIGKTNFFEAILWALTGQTSKGLNMAAVVRQNNKEASVTLDLLGHDGGNANPQRYRITRTVKLAASGKSKHIVDVVYLELDGRVRLRPDGQPDSLADGGVDEVQLVINNLIGGSYLTLKTSAFKFQNDTSPFIRTKPAERKTVIQEFVGLTPLITVHKALDKRRLESAAALKTGEDRLSGMVAVAEDQEARAQVAQADLEKVLVDLEGQRAHLPLAQAAEDKARAEDLKAKEAATAVQQQLDQLPNTAAGVSAAEQELKTYQATQEKERQTKLLRHNELGAEIKRLEAELAGKEAPSSAVLMAKEAALAGAKEGLKLFQTQDMNARVALQGARAGVEASNREAMKLKKDLQEATAKLAALPEVTLNDQVKEQHSLRLAEAEVQGYEAQATELTTEAANAGAAVTTAEAEAKKLAEQRAAYAGQDIGQCSLCKQTIDSSHIEHDLTRIAEDEKKVAVVLAEAKKTKAMVEQKLGVVMMTKLQAAADVKTHQGTLHALQLAAQERGALQATMENLTKEEERARRESGLGAQMAATAQENVDKVTGPLAGAQGQVDALQAELDKAKALATSVAAAAGQLQAKKDEHAKNLAAGLKEKEETAAITEQMEKALEAAKTLDLQNQALVKALRDDLAIKHGAVGVAGQVMLLATKQLVEASTAVLMSEQREKDLRGVLKAIEDQKAAVQAALLELGMMKQRAEIDAMACSLVDPKVGLPVYLIDQALPFLEDRINLYMAELGMDRLTVELTTQDGDKETLDINVDNGRPGPRIAIEAFSGGQLNRVERASKWALADQARMSRGVTFGLVCDDEPTDGLDDEGREGYIRQLHERAGTYPVTLVVSHDETLLRSFDHRLQFTQGPQDETLVEGQIDLMQTSHDLMAAVGLR